MILICQIILAELREFKDRVYEDPTEEIDEKIKKLRQANFKLEYKQRQVGVGPPAWGEGEGFTWGVSIVD